MKKQDNGRIDKTVYDLLCKQIEAEWNSMLLYRQIQGVCDANKMPNGGKYFSYRADEEIAHAKKFSDYLTKRGAKIPEFSIKPSKIDFDGTLLCLVEIAFEHEQEVTEAIVNIALACDKAKDMITRDFLSWFITEQIEEESTFDTIIEEIEKADGDVAAIQNIEWGLPYRSEVKSN
jgi:ferritin